VTRSNAFLSLTDVRATIAKLPLVREWEHYDTLRRATFFIFTAFLAVLFLFPMYWLLKVSLQWPPGSLIGGQPSFLINNPTVYNFIDVFYRINVIQFFWNSIFIVTLVIVGNLIFNSFAAYALTMDFRGRKFVFAYLIAAMMIPFQATIIPAFLVTDQLGLLNTRIGVVLPLSTVIINILILYNSFDAVPESVIESARLDGASELYILFGIYWPLSKPALATNIILAFVFAYNAFLWPLVVITDPALQPLPMALATLQQKFAGNFALQYAFTIIIVLPMIVLFILLQRQFIRSVVASSVKE